VLDGTTVGDGDNLRVGVGVGDTVGDDDGVGLKVAVTDLATIAVVVALAVGLMSVATNATALTSLATSLLKTRKPNTTNTIIATSAKPTRIVFCLFVTLYLFFSRIISSTARLLQIQAEVSL